MCIDKEFETNYKKHFPRVLKFFLSKNVPREEARELAQDTFLRIHQHKGDFRGETSFGNWARIVADSVWKNYIRNIKRDKRTGIVVGLDHVTQLVGLAEDDPEKRVVKEERLDILRQSISKLPTKTRHVVVLRLYQDLGFADIAKVLRRSVETVRSQMSHAKKRLESELGPQACLHEDD